jgi:serine/threonine-protein kinase
MRLKVELAEGKPLFDEQGSAAVLSPDGRIAAFVIGEGAKTWLRLRRLDSLEAVDVPESGGAKGPFFSADGQWIGFFARGRLLKVPVTGGAPSEVTQVRDARGGAWSSRDVIVFAPDTQGGLMRVPAAGGTPEPLTSLAVDAHERTHRWPAFLPGGGEVLFAVQRFGQEYDESTIESVSLKTQARKLVHKGGAYPRYARSGHLLFARRGVLYAARFDREDQKLEGTPRPVLEGLMASLGNEAVGDGSAQYDVSAAGTLLYRTGRPAAREAQLQVLDARGTPVFSDERKHVFYSRPRLSPDARRLAVDIDSQPGVHVWVYDLARREHTRLTFEQNNIVPEWTPDGRFVTFISTPTGPTGDAIYFMSADGSGPQELLFRAEGEALFERSFSPDGRLLALSLVREKTGTDIVLLRLDGPLRKGVKVTGPEPLVATEAEESFPAVSPDGRLLAYATSTNRGDWRVFVRPFPSGEGQREVATGVLPRWSGDGRTLYYQNAGRIHSVAVDMRAPLPAFGDPREVFERTVTEKLPPLEGFYDVAPDGKRFAVIQFGSAADVGRTDVSHVLLAFDWTDELRKLFESR